MEETASSLPSGNPENDKLRVVRFFLPLLLAADGHDPAVWTYAWSLQKLGAHVLWEHCLLATEPISAGCRLSQEALRQLEACLRAHYHTPPRSLQQQAQDWYLVQRHLRRAMPLVEHFLAQQA